MTNHSYKGLTQIDTASPRPARHRVLGVATVTAAAAVRYPAAARIKTSGISVQLFT